MSEAIEAEVEAAAQAIVACRHAGDTDAWRHLSRALQEIYLVEARAALTAAGRIMKTDARPFPLSRYEAAEDAMREEAERIKAAYRQRTPAERAMQQFLDAMADVRRRAMQGDHDEEIEGDFR